MSETQALIKHYQAVRDRLRNPPNAVPDSGINLRRGKEPPITIKTRPPKPVLPAIDWSQVVPFKRIDLTLSSTLEFAAKEFDVHPDDLYKRTRRVQIALPRQVAIWLACRHTVHSLSAMGRYLGMDHTTILHSKRKIAKRMSENDTFRDRILALEEKLIAAYSGVAVPAECEPHLGSEEAKGDAEVGRVSAVDSSRRSTLCDAETISQTPDVDG
jgi:hypothetical protein